MAMFFGTHQRWGGALRRQFAGLAADCAGADSLRPGGIKSGSPHGVSRVGLHDHAMDDIRYFAATIAAGSSGGFFAGSVERTGF